MLSYGPTEAAISTRRQHTSIHEGHLIIVRTYIPGCSLYHVRYYESSCFGLADALIVLYMVTWEYLYLKMYIGGATRRQTFMSE